MPNKKIITLALTAGWFVIASQALTDTSKFDKSILDINSWCQENCPEDPTDPGCKMNCGY